TISNTGPTDLDWRLTVHGTPRDSLAANSPTSSADLGLVGAAVPVNTKGPRQAVHAIHATYGPAALAKKILIYSDDYYQAPGYQWVDRALHKLGLPYTAIYYDPYSFGLAVGSLKWDLVIVDHSNYGEGGYFWNAIESYLRRGGRALISTYDVDGSSSAPTTLWSTIGLAPSGDLLAPSPVYW